MTIATQLSLAEVKAHLSELVSRVRGQHERVTVTVRGRPSAMLIAVEDIEALEETINILADSEAVKELIASEHEVDRHELVTEIELAEAMAARRRSAR